MNKSHKIIKIRLECKTSQIHRKSENVFTSIDKILDLCSTSSKENLSKKDQNSTFVQD